MEKFYVNRRIKQTIESKGGHAIILTIILACMVLIFTLINPNFLKAYNVLSMSQSLAPYGLLALGELFVVASGNTDLSVGAVCIASAAIAGKLYEYGMALWAVIPVMLLCGVLFGCINAYLVAKRNVPSFIATLGTMMFSRGVSAIAVVTPNVFFPSGTWYNRLFSGNNGLPTGILWLLLAALVCVFLMYKNKVGRYLLAIGSNSKAAALSGIRTQKYIFVSYIISGFAAGCAAILWSASFVTIAASTGNGMEFDAMAAVFIGGTGAAGGSASVIGSVLGSLMLVVIRSGLNFALARFNINVNSTYVTYMMTGIIIVTALLLDGRKKKVHAKVVKSVDEKHYSSKQKRIAFGVAIAIMLAFVFGCIGMGKHENSETPVIALLSKSEKETFFLRIRDGAAQAAEENGYDLLYRGAELATVSNLPESLNLVRTAISNDVRAICLCSICEGYTDVLAAAYDAGIPVIEYDSGIYPADKDALDALGKNPIVASVITDCYAAAELCAEKSFKKVKDDIIASDEYRVGLIQYEESKTAENRINGFIDKFKSLCDEDPRTAGKSQFFVEVKPDPTNNNYKLALEALAEKDCDLIFMANVSAANQAYDAILASGGRYDNMKFTAFDCGVKFYDWFRDNPNQFLGAVAQDPKNMGYMSLELMALYLDGKDYPKEYAIDGIWFDAENYEELLEKDIIYYD